MRDTVDAKPLLRMSCIAMEQGCVVILLTQGFVYGLREHSHARLHLRREGEDTLLTVEGLRHGILRADRSYVFSYENSPTLTPR